MLQRSAAISLALAALIGACGGDDGGAAAPRPVTLALDFQPNAVHAGIFAAHREGLDRRHGVSLRIRAPSASTDSLKLLLSGRADASVVNIHDLGLARERGADVVGIGAVVQRPLAAVIARREVRRPRDLEGERLGVTGLPSDDAVARAVLEADGSSLDAVRRTTIGFSAVPSLVTGKVAAVVAFWNAEGVALRERGVRTNEFRLTEYGAPAYPELVVATMRRTLERDRKLVRRVLGALRAGTEVALRDPESQIRRIADLTGSDELLVRAQYEAVAPALRPPLQLDRRALEGWARFDVRFGILARRPDIERAFAVGVAR